MRFAEIAGSSSMLRQLNRESDWRLAIASGGWRISAELKLETIGIGIDEFPAAFADDGFSREDILNSALSKAREHYQQSNFERVVSVGDGLWDVRTASNLKFPFLGIGAGEREKKLREAGASHVIEDYVYYDKLIRILREARIPLKGS